MKIQINNKTLELAEGDITELHTDAIVNAANASLILGAGVAGCHSVRKAGLPSSRNATKSAAARWAARWSLAAATSRRGTLFMPSARARGEGDEEEKLRNATLSSLKVADENGLKSIGFPAISTGVFGFPIERCAEIMLSATIDYLQQETGLERVVFCLYGEEAFGVFEGVLNLKIWAVDFISSH